jgi:hypothetical protein
MYTTRWQCVESVVSLALGFFLAIAFSSGGALGLLDATGEVIDAISRFHAVSICALFGLLVLHVAFSWQTLRARTRC